MKKNDKAVILIVDDKPANILVLENLLAGKDRLLLNATSGEEALKISLNKDVDLIILDVQMPDMDGFEVAQILKSNKRTKNIPIIFATAENKERKFMMKGYDEGAVDYLFKPLDPEIVKAKVTVLLKIQLQKKELIEKNISLQKSALLINNSADIIGIIDASTFRIEEINNALTTILGYSPDEIKGTALTFFLGNEDRLMVHELSKQDKERLSFETRIYCKDRSIKWLQWNVVARYGKWFVNARDITEIKEVEKIRNYIATVVKQSNDAIYIHDREGKIISWNEGAEKIYGYTESEALKMKIWNIIPGYMQPEMGEIVNKIIRGEKIQYLETRRITKHGKLIDILFSASILRETGNDQVSIAITERDITQQKIADEQIKESEIRFRNLFEYAPFPMWVYDLKNLNFLEVNHTSTVLYGYSREEFLTMKITDIRPEEEAQKLLEHVNQRTQKVESSTGWKHRLRSGRIIDVEITSHLLDYKGHKAALVISKDITERKEAEDLIKQKSEDLESANKQLQMFAAMADSSFDFISLADLQGEMFYLNRGGRNLCGLDLEGEFPTTMPAYCDHATWELITREGMPAVQQHGSWQGEGKLRNFHTGEFWDAAMRAFVVINPVTGEPLCMAAIDSDITERKKAEQQIRQLNADLQINVRQLETTNKELESFSYSISHDLRSPLRALSGYSRIMEEDYSQALDDEAKRLLRNIQFNALKMGTLIDDLLAFSRLGRKEVQKSRVDMQRMVENVLIEIGKSEKHNAAITINPLPIADVDPNLFQQVWVNLISNAIKYSGKKEKPEIEIGSKNSEVEITYYVKDNGSGFDMKYADKLFGVFQRLHNPNEFEGTGVGLAIVHRIITKHGGRIWADAKTNEGATFYFTVPKTISNKKSDYE